jgi:hypothetical protein
MSEVNKFSASEQKEDWMAKRWRPAMGWLYMAVCACDFMLFPVLWSIHQAINHGQISSQWQPLTLQGAGLFHLAMGAVLGIAAYGRTQEKIAGAEQGGLGSFGQGAGTTYMPPNSQGMVNVNNTNQAPTSFGTNNTFASSNTNTAFASPGAFGAPAPAFGAPSFGAPAPSFGSKPMGPAQSFPAL